MPIPPRQPRGKTGVRGDMSVSGDSSSAASSHGGPEAPKDTPMLYIAPAPPKKTKHQAPQDAIDEFWEKFTTKTPGKASTVLPKNVHAKKAGDNAPKGAIKGENAVASYEETAKICKEKVEKIVNECRRVNQKYRDPHFDIEFDLKWGIKDSLTMLSANSEDVDSSASPGSVKRVGDIFDNPTFYIKGPTANDVRQGRDGDCWFMAALATLGNKPGLIEKVCVARDEQVGVYGFVFHRDGEWRSEIIDDKLYLTKPDYDESWVERNLIEDRQRINSEEDYRKIYQSGSGALYFAQCEDSNETWLPLLEKAFAKAHGDYAAIEGGFTGEALEDLTGGVTTEIFSTDILDKEYFWKEELLKVNKDFLFGCAAGIFWSPWGYRKGIYEGHAYSIMRAVEMDGQRLCLLRNPWGEGEWTGPWSDGSKEWTPEWMQKLDHRFGDDGAFWISYEDLLKKYQTFDRTRLFTDDWKVTQQWTSLTVPWTVDYHNTKFSFTLEKKAPVVIVLSQLDERYFRGLEGEYSFELSFRVHKAGEEDYIVRSHGNYWMRRSVTAELELEAGEYNVLMKVEAVRNSDASAVEDVVRNNAKDRRDKLLRIGLSYDLAHAKGQYQETDEEKKGRKKAEAAKKAKDKKELKEKLMKDKKKQKHVMNRDKKKERAAAAKRKIREKAKEAKRAEKQKAEAEKAEKEKAEKEKLEKEKAEKEKAEKKDEPEVKKEVKEVKDEVKPADSEKNPETETKVDEKSETIPSEPAATKEPETAPATKEPEPATEESKPTETATAKETEKAPPPAEAAKPVDPPPDVSGPSQLLQIPINGASVAPSVAPSVANLSDDDDDLSDLDSNVSEYSSRYMEDALEQKRLDDEVPAPPPPADDEEDEFEKDPWNAVAVVGLRVYSKESGVSVKVIRPRPWEEVPGEKKLDVDDSARDATKGEDEDKKDEKKEEKVEDDKPKVEEKTDADKKDEAHEEKKDEDKKSEGSDGSVVMV